MRVLAHITAYNHANTIDRTIQAVLQQTRPVDRILLVDNVSSDATLEQPSLKHAVVLRHTENGGTSGSNYSGFRYAIDHEYDWVWLFDGDSLPEPDALEKLLALYAGWQRDRQEETAFLACAYSSMQDGQGILQHAGTFTQRGFVRVNAAPQERYHPCHVCIWSGCLYRLAAIRRIGLPNPDYVMDWGEGEYGYRVMKAGYKGFIYDDALLHHNTRGTSLTSVKVKLGPITLRFRELAPNRCYYVCRNPVYFALYDAAPGYFLLSAARWALSLTLNFLLRPRHHGAQIRACLRGLWDGVTGNIKARY